MDHKQLKQMAEALDVQKKYEERLLKTKGTKTVGVGYVLKGGKETGEIGLIIGVEEKISAFDLSPDEIIPKQIDGVRVDVQKSGIPKAPPSEDELDAMSAQAIDYTDEIAPLTTGYSIGNAKITAGTTGYFAIRNGKAGVTGNAHVLCADPSKSMSEQESVVIMQPGPYDGGTRQRATLKTFVQIQPLPSINYVDSAWAELLNQNDYTPDIPVIGKNKGLDTSDPTLGERIRKVGRTTGYTEGKVNQINVTANINYGTFNATFKELIGTTAMSKGGDSGSIGFMDDNRMKYRLFAGSDSLTLYFPIKKEVAVLSLTPIASDDSPPTPGSDVQVDFIMETDSSGGTVFRVFGNVRQQNGDAIGGATLTLTGPSNLTVQSSDSGSYEFKGLSAGSYSLKCEKTGYVMQNKPVTLNESSAAVPKKLEVAKRR